MYCYTVSGLWPLLTVLWLCPNSVIYSLASGLECLRDVVLPCQVKQVLGIIDKCGPLLGTTYIYPPGLLGSPGTGWGHASVAPLSRERWAPSMPSGARSASRWQALARVGEGLRLRSTSKVVVNPFYVAIEVPGFTRRDLTP